MKKLMLFAALAVGYLSAINAQDISFGAKAGLNLASVSGDDTSGLDSRLSFHLGAVAELEISEKFSIQPELLYSSQGAKYEDSYTDFGFNITEKVVAKYDYLNLPIMAKYYIAEGFSIEAGPQIGVLLKAEADIDVTVSGQGVTQSESATENLNEFTKGIDFGLNFGFGYKLDNGLNFAARYNLGLSNINDGEGSDEFKNQNAVFQISLGYFFK
ncbi:porin family protein [Psychroserpens mesophilus]|uniref:porin family protein n=1 Tax=Psychroserpens mesophilus TaxID=325473 RepID=UPI003F4990B9